MSQNSGFMRGNLHRLALLALKKGKPRTHQDGDEAARLGRLINYDSHLRAEAFGYSGGIWLCWLTEEVTVTLSEVTSKLQDKMRNHGDSLQFMLVQILQKEQLSGRISSNINQARLLAGDFNNTVFMDECHGGVSDMQGHTASTRKWARLDMALYNTVWRHKFDEAVVRYFVAINSSLPALDQRICLFSITKRCQTIQVCNTTEEGMETFLNLNLSCIET
ncbi:hypothetical protein Cgig2_026580 [Carnegiea gigantea]|uniref:Uncharacterized protein n=1 Tax=Carnegiea gigantea TaxID=171969 RepID=A0A9Q1QJZ4_9CARY|nr:hypothetical protein Cgig2_026580 [Carnegiea gigantea]